MRPDPTPALPPHPSPPAGPLPPPPPRVSPPPPRPVQGLRQLALEPRGKKKKKVLGINQLSTAGLMALPLSASPSRLSFPTREGSIITPRAWDQCVSVEERNNVRRFQTGHPLEGRSLFSWGPQVLRTQSRAKLIAALKVDNSPDRPRAKPGTKAGQDPNRIP